MLAILTRMRSAPSGNPECCTITWLSIIVVGAILLRVLLLGSPGNGFDLHTNEGWALSGVVYGTPASYVHQDFGTMLPNYPAFSLSLFSGIGRLYALVSPTLDRGPLLRSLIKLPGVVADVAICIMVFFFVRRIGGKQRALAASAIYAVHPAALGNSAIWGQIDSVHSAFMLGFIMMALDKRWFLAGVLLALGLLSKVQTALLGPLVVVLTFTDFRSLWKLPAGTIAGAMAVLLPFAAGGHLSNALHILSSSVNFYRQTSMNAYNLWFAVYGPASFHITDSTLLPWKLSIHTTGLLLYLASAVVLLWCVRRSIVATPAKAQQTPLLTRATGLLIASAGLSFAFFIVNTQMHERYLQPLVVLGLPLAFVSPRWAWIYGLSTTLYAINMMNVIGGNGWAQSIVRAVPHGVTVIAVCQTLLLAWLFWEALAWRKRLRLSAANA